jgi:ATP-dependent protease ClpP protease subunit
MTQKNHSLKLTDKGAILLNYLFEYGVDFENRVITLSGPVKEGWFDIVDAALTQMEKVSKATVTIRIHSGGGDTYEAMAVVGRISVSKAHIVTEGFGHVMSAATLILACGDKRRMQKYCRLMWHEASYEVDGRHSENKHAVKMIEEEEKLWCETMAEFSDKDAKFWKTRGVGVDKYFWAPELLELGLIDEVI